MLSRFLRGLPWRGPVSVLPLIGRGAAWVALTLSGIILAVCFTPGPYGNPPEHAVSYPTGAVGSLLAAAGMLALAHEGARPWLRHLRWSSAAGVLVIGLAGLPIGSSPGQPPPRTLGGGLEGFLLDHSWPLSPSLCGALAALALFLFLCRSRQGPLQHLASASLSTAAAVPAVIIAAHGYRLAQVWHAALPLTAPLTAPLAAAALLLCALAGMLVVPLRGWFSVLFFPCLGGRGIRRVLPLALLFPLVGGYAVILLSRLVDLDPDMALAIGAVGGSGTLAFFAILHSNWLADVDHARVTAEEQRRASAIQADLIIKTVGGMYWEADPARRRILFSANAWQVLGLPDAAQPLDWNLWEAMVHPEDLPVVLARHRQAVLVTGQLAGEYRIRLGNGRIRRFLSMANVVQRGDEQGSHPVLVGFTLDVTDRIEAAAELRRVRDAAERANAAKTRFLAAASHDMRQPVQALFSYLVMLQEQNSDPELQPAIGSAYRVLDALKALLDGLLDVSRLDAGLVVPDRRDFLLDVMLSRLEMEYRPQAEQRGLQLRTRCVGQAIVNSDPVLLQRMLRNLLENAIRYTESGGVLLSCRRRGGQLRVEIWDTGVGIPAEDHETVFEEFHQLGNPERNRANGLGLGLSVVRRIALLLGHDIGMRSVPGRGSRFWIDLPPGGLPISWPVCQGNSSKVGAAQLSEGAVVLVVDDEEVVLQGLRNILQLWGYQVIAASSAAEAIGALRNGPIPDVALVDYRLRDNQLGTQALSAIFRHLGRRIPAAILTGDTAPERLAEAQRAGFGLLHKPVSPREIRCVLAEMQAGAAAGAAPGDRRSQPAGPGPSPDAP